MGNTAAFQIDAFQNDAFQTYDEYIDVSGKGIRITRVHLCTRQSAVPSMTRDRACHWTTVAEAIFSRAQARSVFARPRRNMAVKEVN